MEFANRAARCIISGVKLDIASAQLCIVDGAWQEAPDNLACFDQAALFGEGVARGNLYLVAEVWGEAEGRDTLAREMIETVRREYVASRGTRSVALALAEAIRIANHFFFDLNAPLPPEARRIAGLTAVVWRDDELFIAQAGPGLVCLVRGRQLQRFPMTSPWFIADERTLYDDEFTTPGAIPLGKRRNYTPDLFHTMVQPGDVVVLATRTLAHLLSNEELIDTLANRHPDEIITGLDELASAADLSVIVLRAAGEAPAPASIDQPIFAPLPDEPELVPPPLRSPQVFADEEERAPVIDEDTRYTAPPPAEPTEEELLRRKARARNAKIRAGMLRVSAGLVGGLAGIFGRIHSANLGAAIDRAISGTVRGIAGMIVLIIRLVVPGDPEERRADAKHSAPRAQTAWQLAAIVFPLLLIAIGIGVGLWYRAEQQRLTVIEVERLNGEATKAFERAEQLAPTDKPGARRAAQQAFDAATQARLKSPNDPRAGKTLYAAKDLLDKLSGIAIVNAVPFHTLSDTPAVSVRIAANYPSVFILDRTAGKIYRYQATDAGASPAQNSDGGVILKTGERVGERTVGQFIDMAMVDSRRLVALDRNGNFLLYELERATWSARPAIDAAAWARVNLIASFAGNVYLVDATNNQILKYAPNADGVWSAATTFFNPGANPNMASVVDLTIERDVWLLKSNGAVWQCTVARCNELTMRELEIPIAKAVAAFAPEGLAPFYIADAGNQRIVQMNKANGQFVRQFKASAFTPEVFKSLKALTADGERFYFVSENKVYLAKIPAAP